MWEKVLRAIEFYCFLGMIGVANMTLPETLETESVTIKSRVLGKEKNRRESVGVVFGGSSMQLIIQHLK